MSLWSDYISERLGHSSIERDWGFATFVVSGEICEIQDIYVRPDFRQGGKGRDLADEVSRRARERGAKRLIGYVWPGTGGAEESLKAQLAYGFKLYAAENGRIILTKEIGGRDGI